MEMDSTTDKVDAMGQIKLALKESDSVSIQIYANLYSNASEKDKTKRLRGVGKSFLLKTPWTTVKARERVKGLGEVKKLLGELQTVLDRNK